MNRREQLGHSKIFQDIVLTSSVAELMDRIRPICGNGSDVNTKVDYENRENI